ncbi:Nucleolar protein 12, partial [Tinamus guttatus]
QRHKEYLKMLSEREEALDEVDELEHLVTAQTESVNIDHPNHIVTVTTISDLDLSGARQLGLTTSEVPTSISTLPSRAVLLLFCVTLLLQVLVLRHFFLSAPHRISSLTASLHMHSRKKTKGKRPQRGQGPRKKIQKSSTGRTTKTQRRRLTGKMGRDQD